MVDRKAFFDAVRRAPFNGHLTAGQVSGMIAILDLWDKRGGTDVRHLAYELATTYHETAAAMQPVEEFGHGRGHPYGVPAGPWHLVYDGRGDVQMTWEPNYKKATSRLRALGFVVDLDRHPEQALQPAIAAMILNVGMEEGWFTGKKLGDYFGAKVDDPTNARRIINGTDKAATVAGYHAHFLTAIRAASASDVVALRPAIIAPPRTMTPTPARAAMPVGHPASTSAAAPPHPSLWARIAAALHLKAA